MISQTFLIKLVVVVINHVILLDVVHKDYS